MKLANPEREKELNNELFNFTNSQKVFKGTLKGLNDAVLMKWINDRRDKETAEGKQVKSKSNITKDYPNHHDYYEY